MDWFRRVFPRSSAAIASACSVISEEVQEFWGDFRGIVVAGVLAYVAGYMMAVGFRELADARFVLGHPLLDPIAFIVLFLVFGGTFEGWLEGKKECAKGLVLLSAFAFLPIVMNHLGQWLEHPASAWLVRGRFVPSLVLLSWTIISILVELCLRKLRKESAVNASA